MSDSLWPHGLYSPWNSPGQNTGVGSLSLLQGIFPTQGSNPGLPHCRWVLYQLSHKGSPRMLEWGACPFSSRSSRPRDQTGVSCIAGGFLTNWAIREAQTKITSWKNESQRATEYPVFSEAPKEDFKKQSPLTHYSNGGLMVSLDLATHSMEYWSLHHLHLCCLNGVHAHILACEEEQFTSLWSSKAPYCI